MTQKINSFSKTISSVSKRSCIELIFAKNLASHFKTILKLYEPRYTEDDFKLLKNIDNIEIMATNNDCLMPISEPSIIVGVHLYRKLYENLLSANSTDPSNIFLIGNAIPEMLDSHNDFDFDLKTMEKLEHQILTESLENCFDPSFDKFSDIFSGTVCTVFPSTACFDTHFFAYHC